MGAAWIARHPGFGAAWNNRIRTLPWWALILALVALEALALLVLAPVSWRWATGGDGAEYQRYAANLLHHGVFSEAPAAPYYPGVVRSPGYPALLAAVEWFTGPHVVGVEIVQFAGVALMAVLVGSIGRMVAGPRIGTVAAVMCAIYLPFLSFATSFLTEDLASLGVTIVAWLLIRHGRSDRAWPHAVTGVALVALTYVRPESALLAIPIALVLLLGRSGPWRSIARWRPAVAFVLAFALPLVPWTIRNASVTGGKLVPMSANSGSDLLASADQYRGIISDTITTFHAYDAQVGRLIGSPATAAHGIQASVESATPARQLQIDQVERTAALRSFRALPVATLLAALPKRMLYLWGVAYPAPPGRFSGLAHDLAVLQWMVWSLLAVLGLVARRRRLRSEWPLWMGAAYLSLAHVVFHVETRYTLPARPVLMIYAATAVIGIGSLLRRPARASDACATKRSTEPDSVAPAV